MFFRLINILIAAGTDNLNCAPPCSNKNPSRVSLNTNSGKFNSGSGNMGEKCLLTSDWSDNTLLALQNLIYPISQAIVWLVWHRQACPDAKRIMAQLLLRHAYNQWFTPNNRNVTYNSVPIKAHSMLYPSNLACTSCYWTIACSWWSGVKAVPSDMVCRYK